MYELLESSKGSALVNETFNFHLNELVGHELCHYSVVHESSYDLIIFLDSFYLKNCRTLIDFFIGIIVFPLGVYHFCVLCCLGKTLSRKNPVEQKPWWGKRVQTHTLSHFFLWKQYLQDVHCSRIYLFKKLSVVGQTLWISIIISMTLDFWSIILFWHRQQFLGLFGLQTKFLTYNRLDIRLVHTSSSLIPIRVNIMTFFLVI